MQVRGCMAAFNNPVFCDWPLAVCSRMQVPRSLTLPWCRTGETFPFVLQSTDLGGAAAAMTVAFQCTLQQAWGCVAVKRMLHAWSAGLCGQQPGASRANKTSAWAGRLPAGQLARSV